MSDFSSSLPIETPENIVLNAEIAGFGTRCVAALIDYAILIGALLIIEIAASPAIRSVTSTWTLAALTFLQFAVLTFYHLLFELAWNGQTPGKRLIGIRVVQANGMPLTESGAVIRNLVRLFDYLPLLYAVGLLALFATKHTQRLGDLAAKTIVIRERRKLTLDNLREDFSAPFRYASRYAPLPPSLAPYIQIARLSEADRREVVGFLRRRDSLSNAPEVARVLADRIAAQMGVAERASLQKPESAIIFLEYVARAFEIEEQGSLQTSRE